MGFEPEESDTRSSEAGWQNIYDAKHKSLVDRRALDDTKLLENVDALAGMLRFYFSLALELRERVSETADAEKS